MSLLTIDEIVKQYETAQDSRVRRPAINKVSFDVAEGSFVSIIGPSGCGKTTLLKIVGALMAPTSGEVCLRGSRVISPPKEMIFVFQDYNKSLLPWRTVGENVCLSLEVLKIPKNEHDKRINKYLKMVSLDHVKTRYPWELSGGMQQRVQLARALAYEPKVLLMDEPLGSLDSLTRSQIQDDLLSLWEELEMTVLYVTHDLDEAVYLADRVIVLSSSPASVKADIDIKLPRPRDQVATRSHRQFIELRANLYQLMSDEAKLAIHNG